MASIDTDDEGFVDHRLDLGFGLRGAHLGNELGEFESGVAARFLGPVGAVILGGSVAIAVALLWTRLFPDLANADSFEGVEEQSV